MKKLEKYFLKSFFITWLVVFLSFSLIFLSLQINFYYVRYFKYLELKEYIYLTLFTLLNIFPIIFPIGYALSMGYIFGKWAQEKKILSLKILGFSFFKISRIFIGVSFLFSLFLSIYYLFFLPEFRKKFDEFLKDIFKKNFIVCLEPKKKNKIGKIEVFFKYKQDFKFKDLKLKYENITIFAKEAQFLYKNNTLFLKAKQGNLFSNSINFHFEKANLKLLDLNKSFFSFRLKGNFWELLEQKTFSSYFEIFIRISISLSILFTGLFLLRWFYNKSIFDIKYSFKVVIVNIIIFYSLYSLFYVISQKTLIPYFVLLPNLLYLILFFILTLKKS